MENQQLKINETEFINTEIKTEEKPKPFFNKIAKLEKEVAKLERQIEIIIKSLRR